MRCLSELDIFNLLLLFLFFFFFHFGYSTSVSCFIMQKNGAGVVSACSAFCDNVNDGIAYVKWPTDKSKDSNKSMVCIATVGAMHL